MNEIEVEMESLTDRTILDSAGKSLRYEHKVEEFDNSTHYGRLLQKVGSNKRVLELGSSSGYLTDAMRDHFSCSVVGVEIDGIAANKSIAKGNLVYNINLDQVNLVEVLASEGKFDVILCADVLEHLRNPEQVLRSCHALLNDDGTLVASIPNMAHADVRLSLLAGSIPFRPMGILDDTHVKFFTRASVESLLTGAGFVIDDASRNLWGWTTTEVRPSLQICNQWLRDLLACDPESETYQFIITAKKAADIHEANLPLIDVVVLETGFQRADDVYNGFLRLINYPMDRINYWVITDEGKLKHFEEGGMRSYSDNDFRTFRDRPMFDRSIMAAHPVSHKVFNNAISHTALESLAKQSKAEYFFFLETNSLPAAKVLLCLAEALNAGQQPPLRAIDEIGGEANTWSLSGVLISATQIACLNKRSYYLTSEVQARDFIENNIAFSSMQECAGARFFSNGPRLKPRPDDRIFKDNLLFYFKKRNVGSFLSYAIKGGERPSNLLLTAKAILRAIFYGIK